MKIEVSIEELRIIRIALCIRAEELDEKGLGSEAERYSELYKKLVALQDAI